MISDVGQNCRERSQSNRIVGWHRDVMLTWCFRRQANMTPGLASNSITDGCQRPRKFEP